MKRICTCVALMAVLVGCSNSDRSARTDTPRALISLPSGRNVSPTTQDDIRTVVTLDPNSTETQIVTPAPGSPLAGVVVAIRPGSLSIPTDLVLQQGQTFESASFLDELEMTNLSVTGNGVPVSITASQPIDLINPMVIAFPIPTAASLLATTVNRDKLALLYRVKVQASGENLIGIVPGRKLSFQGDKILYETKYLGWFQIVLTNEVVTESKSLQAKSVAGIALETVSKLIDLPSCGAADVGRTIYVLEDNIFRYCASNGWTSIDLRGAKGDTGTAGTNGSNGTNGTDGLTSNVYNSATNTAFGRLVLMNDEFLVRVTSPTTYKAAFRQKDGKYLGSLALNENLTYGLDGRCFFTNATCSGPCYLVNPIVDGLFAGPSSTYFKASRSSSPSQALVDYYYAPLTNQCTYTFNGPSISSYQFYPVITPTAIGSFSWDGYPIYLGE